MELEKRARALHWWFNQATRQDVPWTIIWRFRWEEWLNAGFNGPQLRSVLLYRRKQVHEGKRHMRSMSLINLLEPESFQADLGLINMRKAGNMDIEKRLPAAPEQI